MRPASRTWRIWAALLSSCLGIAVFALSPTASADTSPATFTWAFSPYMQTGGQLVPTAPTGSATIDSTQHTIVFGGGAGATHSGTGVTDLTYDGSVTFSDPYGGNYYRLTFANPEVTVNADGNGTIYADVSYVVQGATGGSNHVALTTFSADTSNWSGSTLAATPKWTGIAPTDHYGSGKPANGASWSTGFVDALPASVRGFFYASGTNPTTDTSKAPASFSAVAATAVAPSLTYATTSASHAGGLNLSVNGTGFRGVTKPGDAGIYVGLAPAGSLPDVSSQAGMAAFSGVAYVSASAINNGAFATTLTAPTDKLNPATSYALYTWQAHAHSNTSQDTQTLVTIDWAALATPSTSPTPSPSPSPSSTPTPSATATPTATATVTNTIQTITTTFFRSLGAAITAPAASNPVPVSAAAAGEIQQPATSVALAADDLGSSEHPQWPRWVGGILIGLAVLIAFPAPLAALRRAR